MSAQLTYALHQITNRIVSINDTISGLDCKCICPLCHEPVMARKGEKNAHHFAHRADSTCEGAEETALHQLAKQILSANTYIRLPDDSLFNYDEVLTETWLHNFRPDLILKNGTRQLIVEIYVTHRVTSDREKDMMGSGIPAVEIDLSRVDREISEEALTAILIDQTTLKKMLATHADTYQTTTGRNNHLWQTIVVAVSFILGFILIRKLIFSAPKHKRNYRR